MSPFEQELRRLGKRRIRLAELRDAYFRAHREALDAPDSRRLLHDALRDLKDDGAVELPARGWDESGSPPLPRTVLLRNVGRKGTKRAAQAWLPALAFAADERNPARRSTLEAINAFLIARRGEKLRLVPTRERSLHIFGDEKRLDNLRKSKTTLFEGRISLRDLSCYPVAPPLPVETNPRWTRGRPVLVLENYHSYESFACWNHKARQYAAIAYGGGNAFRQGAGKAHTVMLEGKDGQSVAWAPNRLAARSGGVEVYRAEEMELRAGDRVRWTRNDAGLGLVNSQTAEVAAVAGSKVTFRLGDGRMLDLAPGDPQLRHIDRAWASTVHAFQGRTVDTVIAAMEANHPNLTTQKTLYVEISRARDRAELVTDDKAALRETLEAATGERIAALEAVEPERAKDRAAGLDADRSAGRGGGASESRQRERCSGLDMEEARTPKSVDRDLGL